MIMIKVRNGIGNQLFSFAFGEYLKNKFPNQIIKYDFSELPYYVNGRYTACFTDFVEDANILTPKEVRKYLGKILYFHRLKSNGDSLLDKIERKIINNVKVKRNYNYIFEPIESEEKRLSFTEETLKMKLSDECNYLFDGFWEDIRYVDNVKNILRKKISFSKIYIKDEYRKLLNNHQLVSIHIRRGDYIKESFEAKYPRYFYAYCDDYYYDKAIKFIMDYVENPILIFFSDDTKYVNEKYNYIDNKVVVEGQKDYEDLYFMTLCNHHIIANSTFSFWGAFLSLNSGITIAPNIHYSWIKSKDNFSEKKFFYVEGWKYIEVGDRLKS